MIDSFKIPSSSLKRNYTLYIILCKPIKEKLGDKPVLIYVGKTGDNRKGWNPIISRIGTVI